MSLEIEAKILNEMVQNMIIPAGIRYQSKISQNISQLKQIGLNEDTFNAQLELVKELGMLINKAQKLNGDMEAANERVVEIEGAKERAIQYNEQVRPYFEQLREVCDGIERLCDDTEWTLPKYRELLSVH